MARLKKSEVAVTITVDLKLAEFYKLKGYAKQHNTKMVRVVEKYIDGLRIPGEQRKAKLTFEGIKGEVIRKTYSVRPETKIKAEIYAEMYGITVSDVIRRCIASLK
jgi:hypothetical protein